MFENIPTSALLVTLLLLTFMSAYFASSETAMMKLNPYRLKHKVKQKHRGARKANRLLRRTDRLLGVILIGNNLVNNFAMLVAGLIFIRWFGEAGYPMAGLVLTVLFLVFAEIGPKTIAAARPESIAYPSSYILQPLLALLSPIVLVANKCAEVIVKPFVPHNQAMTEQLTIDELRTVVDSEADIPEERQEMLLRILDLEHITVQDIMIPSSDVVGIDLDDDDDEIEDILMNSSHGRLPIYEGNINTVRAVLSARKVGKILSDGSLNREELLVAARPPYFVPLGTSLTKQIVNFQKEKNRIALVVDEYGDVKGLVTLEDILEQIVGEYTTDSSDSIRNIHPQGDNQFIIDGSTPVREANTALSWGLPVDGPRTINGLLLERLEDFPEGNVGIKIGRYLFVTTQITENEIRSVSVTQLDEPELKGEPDMDEDEPSA